MEDRSAFDVVVVAASLGGPDAVRGVLSRLPAWFPCAVVVVQHRTLAAERLTVEVLARHSRLPVEMAVEGGQPRRGTVHVAPAVRPLTIDRLGLFAPPRRTVQRGYTADSLMRAAAERFGRRALGVVLSGLNDDGAAGAATIKGCGGRVIVQDRATARSFAMPAAAIATGCVDLVLPVERIADALVSLAMWPGAAELLRVPLPPWAIPEVAFEGAAAG